MGRCCAARPRGVGLLCSSSGDRVKLVFWNGPGVYLFAKRLEEGEQREAKNRGLLL